MIAWLGRALALLLLAQTSAFAGDGFLVPRRQALGSCVQYLDPTESSYRRGLLRHFGRYHVIDGERLGHHEFRLAPDDQNATEPVQLLDLTFGEDRWRRERWISGPKTYYFYDVGFRNLEEDAQNMNSLVAGVLLSSNSPCLVFTSSAERTQALERLSTYRYACFDRVMKTYRNHRNKRKYLGELDFRQFLAADRANLNVDVFALTNERLDWDADRRRISDTITSTIQISYEQPFADLLRPSLDGLLAAHNEVVTASPRLPFMERLDPDQRDRFLARLDASFPGLSKCEVTRYINPGTPARVIDHLIREVFERVRDRGCDLMVASGDDHSLRLFKRYGFTRDRRLPTLGSAEESLAVLRVRSPLYAEKLASLYAKSRDVQIDEF